VKRKSDIEEDRNKEGEKKGRKTNEKLRDSGKIKYKGNKPNVIRGQK
jgi:hypothetical protein